ncbi:MAG: hypothetical protein M3Q47_01795 [Actinomycetota bacterium]|nr:hypothetical protein [Actinomycetota bacterium]
MLVLLHMHVHIDGDQRAEVQADHRDVACVPLSDVRMVRRRSLGRIAACSKAERSGA